MTKQDETVELSVKLNKRIYEALSWYVRQTSYWISNDHEKESMNEIAAYAIEAYLDGQLADPVDAIDAIKNELRVQLDLEE